MNTALVYANPNALATLVTCISFAFIASFVLVRGWHNKVCRIFGHTPLPLALGPFAGSRWSRPIRWQIAYFGGVA